MLEHLIRLGLRRVRAGLRFFVEDGVAHHDALIADKRLGEIRRRRNQLANDILVLMAEGTPPVFVLLSECHTLIIAVSSSGAWAKG